MNKDDIELLKNNGWTVECESPFEIRHVDGSFATGQAAEAILDGLKENRWWKIDVQSGGY